MQVLRPAGCYLGGERRLGRGLLAWRREGRGRPLLRLGLGSVLADRDLPERPPGHRDPILHNSAATAPAASATCVCLTTLALALSLYHFAKTVGDILYKTCIITFRCIYLRLQGGSFSLFFFPMS